VDVEFVDRFHSVWRDPSMKLRPGAYLPGQVQSLH
jgi:hypothetical protein